MKTISLLSPLLIATYVSAHGFLSTITIKGKAFNGNVPSGKTAPSIIRQVTTPSPNKGTGNPALTCGPNSTAGSLIADASPGDGLTFDWRGADLSHWPHNTGPMLTYMSSCGSKTCDQFDISQAKWFKIQQVGRKSDSAWFQADLMTGGVAMATIPKTLAPGNYLIRHEIIALHLATSFRGAEFYPACAQVLVHGSQTGRPMPSELVSIPGAYGDNDPGIFDTTVFNPSSTYVFPGPSVARFVSGTATMGSNAPSTTTSSAMSSSAMSSKSCKIKKHVVS